MKTAKKAVICAALLRQGLTRKRCHLTYTDDIMKMFFNIG